MAERVLIMGAAGRDFHTFNVRFRGRERYQVVGFTAAQIPHIQNRRYPPELAGRLYPRGLPIFAEDDLPALIRRHKVDLVIFSYSDIPYSQLMRKASRVLAAGADFALLGASSTMLRSSRPVISVCAVRTGCGKSQVSRQVFRILRRRGQKAVFVRHPMPYGDLSRQAMQRFGTLDDLTRQECTIEEREEFEPLLALGGIVYAGVDYEPILRRAEQEAELIIWDGGNNDTPFFRPDLHIVVFDPHRAGHETAYYPGETNLLLADIAVINKVDSASPEAVEQVRRTIAAANPEAEIVLAESRFEAEDGRLIQGQRVLVVEDGPSLTHGEMPFGAGLLAARHYEAAEIVDPRPYARGGLGAIFDEYRHIGPVLPAVGYSTGQIRDLEETIQSVPCDLVVSATPVDLQAILAADKPVIRVGYDYGDHGRPTLEEAVLSALSRKDGRRRPGHG